MTTSATAMNETTRYNRLSGAELLAIFAFWTFLALLSAASRWIDPRGDRLFSVRERMQTLEEQLDPNLFMRVHRSVIVRLDRVDAMLRSAGGDYAVRLKDGTKLSVSRAKRHALEERLKKG